MIGSPGAARRALEACHPWPAQSCVTLQGRCHVCRRLQRAARSTGRTYHLTGPLALARDLVIRAMGPKRMMARQSWIYDWQP